MRVLVFERNLMWSSKLVQSLKALGHEALLVTAVSPGASVAIVNLSDPGVGERVSELHAAGAKVIGHAGHKEKELLELGRLAGVDVLATNSELTFKLPEILAGLS